MKPHHEPAIKAKAILRKNGWAPEELWGMSPGRIAEIAAAVIRRKALWKLRRERMKAWRKANPLVSRNSTPTLRELGMDKPRWELLREMGIECAED